MTDETKGADSNDEAEEIITRQWLRSFFKSFQGEWQQHRAEWKIVMLQVAATQSSLAKMEAQTANLQELPHISAHMKAMNENVKGNNKSLLLLLSAVVFSVALFGAIVLVVVLKDSTKDVTLNRNGLSVTESRTVRVPKDIIPEVTK